MNGQPASIFQVEGVVVRDAHQGPNFSYVTIREGEKQYWDVACFEDGPLDAFRQLRGGAIAKIRGHLGKRKIKGFVDQNGRERYELQLIADKLQAREQALPLQPHPGQWAPAAPSPPQYMPNAALQGAQITQPLGPWAGPANYPNPQWPNPQQPLMPTHVQQQQTGAEHPGSFDGDDGIPF
jgi:hypothetical protein